MDAPEGRAGRIGTFRSALSHRAFALLVVHYAVGAASIGVSAVVVSIELYERSGSTTWASVGVLARIVPFVLCSPLAGVIGDRYDGVRVVRWTSTAATAGAVLLLVGVDGAPLWALAAIAFATHVGWAAAYPTTASLVPAAVGSESLAPAIGIVTAAESISWFVGPGLGGLLISEAGPRAAMAVAVALGATACALGPVLRRWWPADAFAAGTERDVREPFGSMLFAGLRTVFGASTLRVPLALLLVGDFVYGVSQVVLLVAATSFFGLSEGGFGLLGAAISGGALLALAVVNRLARFARQSLVVLGVAAAVGVPISVSAAAGTAAVAVPLLVVSGLGLVSLEVLLLTALQRSAPSDQLSRLFGILDSLLVTSLMVGSVVAAPLMAAIGTRGALLAVGLVPPLAAVVATPWLTAGDRRIGRLDDVRDTIDVLAGLRVLRHAPPVVVEALAVGADEQRVAPGVAVVSQGDRADAFFAVLDGQLDITVRDGEGRPEVVATIGPGDGFGELGLLHDVPRQATVTAATEATLVRVPGDLFLRVLGPGRVTGGGTGVAGSLRDLWSTG